MTVALCSLLHTSSASKPHLPFLTFLNIDGQAVTDYGVETLASCLTLSLRSLTLQDCNQVTNTACG